MGVNSFVGDLYLFTYLLGYRVNAEGRRFTMYTTFAEMSGDATRGCAKPQAMLAKPEVGG